MSDNIKTFAGIIAKILKTDRWIFIACDGDMGEGKSCFTSQLAKEIAKQTGTPFSYQGNMTFQRKELKTWLDGDNKGQHQKLEYSVLLADELISMFFKRNWFDSDQIDGIELLNKCRDRHQCVLGNIPSYWDLDSAIFSVITFWVHIHERGIAWVFQKDRNPFATDKWHRKANEKTFRKSEKPYKCKGFLSEIAFEDWREQEKIKYYAVRNKKRVKTEGQREKEERYSTIKRQRDEMIKLALHSIKGIKQKDLADVVGISPTAIGLIANGLR